VDIAGLVRGAHRGEGLGNQFLGHIRNVDAIAMVVRCFEEENVAHIDTKLDPPSDIETVWTELILADLEIVQRRITKVQSSAKARPRDFTKELDWLHALHDHLDAGNKARSFAVSDTDDKWLSEVALLTVKPYIYVANVDENDLPDGEELALQVCSRARDEDTEAVVLCAQTEMELQEWPPDEAEAYLSDLGIAQSGLQKLVRAGYRMLNLVTFFTATGTKTVQSWAVQAGIKASQAAGKIHSDMERGFIRAEVVAFDDLKALTSFAAVKEHGKLRVEGRDYVVQDGDVLHFRFNV
jgi:GTP-binding protein YchF